MKTFLLVLGFYSFVLRAETLDPVVLGVVELTKQDLFEVASIISEMNIQLVHEEAIEKRIQALLMTSILEAKKGKGAEAVALLKRAKVVFRQPAFQKSFQTPYELKEKQRIEDSIALVEYDLGQILERERL